MLAYEIRNFMYCYLMKKRAGSRALEIQLANLKNKNFRQTMVFFNVAAST